MLRDRVREVTTKARIYTRMAERSGLLGAFRAPGAIAGVKTLVRGGKGPSALFRIHAANTPDRVAFVFGDEQFTFAETDERVDRMASAFRARGLRAGDSVVLLLKNRPECLEIGAAMARISGAAVSVSWRSTPAELTYFVNHSGARAIFFEAELWPTVESAHTNFTAIDRAHLHPVGGEVEGLTSMEALLSHAPTERLEGSEATVIIYTSGTTGKPKGAVRKISSGQIVGFAAFIGETPMRIDDKHLAVCPLYHSTGLGFLGMSLMLGCTVVIEREFDPERFLATVQRERITTTAIVPTMLHRLMSLPTEVLDRYDTRSLRMMICGGAQLPAPLAERALDRFGPVLFNFYGSTETGLVTVATPYELRVAPGTIGHAVPGNSIRLLDDERREVRDGEVGELFVRNEMLVEGYHADAASTRESMRDGYFSVGDLAMRDRFGLYHIVGRRRDMVISGGVNVYPAEVEGVIEKHPAVAQVAVIGVPDSEWGERLRAFVVPRSGCDVTANDLRAFCRETLSGAKVPREYVFLEALPANATGKVLKRELKEWVGNVEKV
jgi:fatty-acyl-CoA synthase